MVRLIGINGKARSGKDEVASIFGKAFGFQRASFADKVKDFGTKYFDLKRDECFEKKTATSRMILQGIGQFVREYPALNEYTANSVAVDFFGLLEEDLSKKRKINRQILNGIRAIVENHGGEIKEAGHLNYWVEHLFSTFTPDTVYVIPDVRYTNEFDMIKEAGGKLVKVHRVDNPEIEHGENHESETQLDNRTDWDYSIVNTHDKDWHVQLNQSASNCVRSLVKQKFFTKEDISKFNIIL